MIAVGREHVAHALGQHTQTVLRAQRAAPLDHVLAGRLEAFGAEILSNHIGERDGIEAPPLEQSDHLGLAGGVQPRDANPHA